VKQIEHDFLDIYETLLEIEEEAQILSRRITNTREKLSIFFGKVKPLISVDIRIRIVAKRMERCDA
jgi:hypothetical protein